MQDWQSYAGGDQVTTQPGTEGARRGVLLSLLVDPCLCFPPDQLAQLSNTLPASPVGSLRAHVQGACLVDVIQPRRASEDPQSHLHRCTQAFREVCVFSRSTTHLGQRQLGRLASTPSLQYRADEVMRNMPVLST